MTEKTREEADQLVGRAREQTLLSSLLDGLPTRGQALVLKGEAGIGKSRLLMEVSREARDRGMTVLSHAIYVSQPQAVARLIEQAAQSVGN